MPVYVQSLRLLKENWGFCLFMLLMFASRSSLADWYHVPSGSMLPTIQEGDRIFVNKMAYRLEVPFTDISIMELNAPARGDIVVFESERADERLIKRVIGLPGDTVSMYKNRLSLNGTPLDYGRVDKEFVTTEMLGDVEHAVKWQPAAATRDSFRPLTIPEGYYLVLGDNRNNSMDSRYYGLVPASELQGKAISVVMSLDQNNFYLPKSDRWMQPLI